MYLHKTEIEKLLISNELIIRPLLDQKSQIGEFTIDFRLGTDFLVSVHGREPYVDTTLPSKGTIRSFFQATRRRFGQEFIFYPNQTVLCSSLEFLKLPNNIFATLTMRSSFSRLGLSISTIVQAGYVGCISIELTNVNHNPIKVAVGTRLFQARLCTLETNTDYDYKTRKYVCQVRPELSRIEEDKDLDIIKKVSEV